MDKPEAIWHISLDVCCPHCGEYVDLTDNSPDFWHGMEVGQHVEDYEACCPNCGKDFICDVIY